MMMKLALCLVLGMFTWNTALALALRSGALGASRLSHITGGNILQLGSRRTVLMMDPQHTLFSRPPLLANEVKQAVQTSPVAVKALDLMPNALKLFLSSVHPGELFLLLLFRAAYSPVLKFAHRMQNALSKATKLGEPSFWPNSVLAFVHERSQLLTKVMVFNYMARLACVLLTRLGFNLRPGLPDLLSRISYTLFFTHFVDRFKSQFLRVFFPHAVESRRQSYLINKTTSVAVWTIGALAACEMISSFLKIPLSSTLAFGGIGGLTIGLSLKDMAANFMGGVMLLMNEPFTPGDMVTFLSGKTEIMGRVERVGWGQTRIRGLDTRPTYVPNSHFAQAAVTNIERITHRKFEIVVPIRFEDHARMAAVVERIKQRLRSVPKLDTLSMPLRVSFVKVGAFSLDIEILCYFAAKSLDEFLDLQQAANLEVLAAIQECGAGLATPSTHLHLPPSPSPSPSPSDPSLLGSHGAPLAALLAGRAGSLGAFNGSSAGAGGIRMAAVEGLARERQLNDALQGIPLPAQDGALPL